MIDNLRRTAITLVVGALLLALSVGVAYAATKLCDDPVCNGTDGRDVLIGTKIDNVIYGYGAKDVIRDTAGPDQDTVYGGSGKDVIDVREGNNNPRNADYVDCGTAKIPSTMTRAWTR